MVIYALPENLPETVPDGSKNKSKNTPFATLLALREKYPKISARHMGKLVGISHSAVVMMFQRHGWSWELGRPVELESFKDHRADILAIKQLEVLSCMTGADIKKASARDKAVIFGILHDHERLERGESTANVATSLTGLICKLSGNSRGLVNDPSPVVDAEIVPDSRGDADV